MIRFCLAVCLIIMLGDYADAQNYCPNCPQGTSIRTTTIGPPATYGCHGSARSKVVYRATSFRSPQSVSYRSVGSGSSARKTSFFRHNRFTGRSRYVQRWTVAGGNGNIVNHLSNHPHGFNVAGMSMDEMLALHDSHHDKIGPIAMVGNAAVSIASGVTYRVRSFGARVRGRFRGFFARRRGC